MTLVEARDTETLEVLNPTAERYGLEAASLSPRLGTLEGLTVGLLWNGKPNGDVALELVGDELRRMFPQLRTQFYRSTIRSSPEILEKVAQECDAVVACTADCGACTSWIVYDCVQLERKGIPSVVIVSAGFEDDFEASARAFGLQHLLSVVVPEGYNNITSEVAIEQTIPVVPMVSDSLIGRASSGQAAHEDTPTTPAPRLLKFDTDGSRAAFEAFNDYFSGKDWGDGYPLFAPTIRKVDDLLTRLGADGDEVISVLPPGNGEVTARGIAIAGAMAGCQAPELAVVEAAVRALSDEHQKSMIRSVLMSTSAHAPIFVVNGPVGKALGLNSGRGCVGPGSINAVNNRIGRAILLCLKNLGALYPGVMDLDSIGTTRKNIVVVAENEDESPWTAFHVEHGYASDDNVVSLTFSNGEWDVAFQGHIDSPQLARAIGSYSGGPNLVGYFEDLFDPEAAQRSPAGRLLLLAPPWADVLDKGGLSKDDFRQILFDTCREPVWKLIEPLWPLYKDGKILPEWRWLFELAPDERETMTLPVVATAEDFSIVICGAVRGKGLLMPTRCRPIGAAIRQDWLGS